MNERRAVSTCRPYTVIVLPAYNAERTLAATYHRLPPVYDAVFLCDDASVDRTAAVSRKLHMTTMVHPRNCGYGANQKTLYDAALASGAEVIVMVHPDNQYDTAVVPQMVAEVARGAAIVLGTRMHAARRNGMPIWKRIGNRLLTAVENAAFRTGLSELHSGLRAYDARVLRQAPYRSFSDGFVFDSEMLAWLAAHSHRFAEVPTDCRYTRESSSVNFVGSVAYGFATLRVVVWYLVGVYRKKISKIS